MPTVDELKKLLKNAGLKTTGLKANLSNRLARAKAGATLSANRGRGAVAVPRKKSPAGANDLVRGLGNLKISNAPKPRPPSATLPKSPIRNLGKLKVANLKQILKNAGLKVTGTRGDLEMRIRKHRAGATSPGNRPGGRTKTVAPRRLVLPPEATREKLEETKREFERLLAEFESHGPWSSHGLEITDITFVRAHKGMKPGKATLHDMEKFDILREMGFVMSDVDLLETNNNLGRNQDAFVRWSSRVFDKLVNEAPKNLRFYISS